MAILYFDCFSGASGDMILGALIDAGVPLAEVRRALGSLAIEPELVWTDRVMRAGITATKFQVAGQDLALDRADDHEHPRDHGRSHHHPHGEAEAKGSRPRRSARTGRSTGHHASHGHGAHRTLAEIHALIEGSSLSAPGKQRAKRLFDRLGEAEAAIHGTPLDKVHLHEVGALDSIIDVVGTVFALEWLGVQRAVASPLNMGSGSVRSSHGLYPVPAPATIRLLEGVPVYSGTQRAELVTPTGALLVTEYASAFGPVPPMRVRRVGYGAGSRDLEDTPNVLRVLVGDSDPAATPGHVTVIEAEIDDMNPQIFGMLMDRLLGDGALDVYYTPIQMKKNRPGTLLTVIAPPAARERLTSTIFRETTTIGVRYGDMLRECLDREVATVQTTYGPVRVKVARRDGQVLNAAPEFDDCARLAGERGVPLKDVQAAAVRAYHETHP